MVNSGHATVTPQFTKAIARALEQSALTLTPVIADLLTDIEPYKRVPMALQDKLWETLVATYPEPGLGLQLGSFVQPGNLDIVGFLLMSCDTLEDALDVLLTYHPIVGEGGEFISTQNDHTCQLIYAPFHNVCRVERVEAVMATLVQLTKYLTGGAFEPSFISFQHAAQISPAEYEKQLGCPVRFAQLADAVIFPLSQFNLPLQQANSALLDQMRKLADDELLSLQPSGLEPQVCSLVKEHPNWGKEKVADCLGMSGRHLNRMLAREGFTFKIISDRTKFKIATSLLLKKTPSSDIADILGFHDESAFFRAFKRWTGKTPAEYRL